MTALALGVPALLREGLHLAGHPPERDGRGEARDRLSRAQPARARSDWRSERVVCSTAVGS